MHVCGLCVFEGNLFFNIYLKSALKYTIETFTSLKFF